MRRTLAIVAGAGAALFAWTAIDLLAGGPLTQGLDPAANDAVLAAQTRGVPVGDVGSILSLLGTGPVNTAMVIAAAAVLAWWRRWADALAACAMPWLAGRLVDLWKEAFTRGFPPGDVSFATGAGAAAATVRNPEPFTGVPYAFPSGHVMGAVVAAGLAVLLLVDSLAQRRQLPARQAKTWRRRAVWATVAVAALVGLGRVLLTVHWATDVVASWGIGATLVCGTLWATRWGTDPPAPAGDAALGRARRQPAVHMVRVLGFTGMPGSGKSEAMEVAKARGIPVVRMGDLIWEEVERRGLPRDAKHVGEVANEMRQSHGKDVWSLRTVDRVRQLAAGQRVVIIDGVRSDAEVQTFRTQLGGDFVLVAIHTDRHHRFERMLKRARADDPKDESILQARDEREIGWGMAQCIALADEMIVNDSTLPEFRRKVERLLDRVAKPVA